MRPRLRPVGVYVQADGDCCQVATLEPGVFLVEHYPSRAPGTRPCCRIRVTVSDADRAKAIPEGDPHGEAAALARVDRELARRHGGV